MPKRAMEAMPYGLFRFPCYTPTMLGAAFQLAHTNLRRKPKSWVSLILNNSGAAESQRRSNDVCGWW